MTIEEKLKDFILSNHKSIRDFCNSAKIPYTTVMNLLNHSIKRATVTVVFQVCDALGIDANALLKNEIVQNSKKTTFAGGVPLVLQKYNHLSKDGQNKVMQYIDDLLASGNYDDGDEICATVDSSNKKSLA